MSKVTTDPSDPKLGRGGDTKPSPQNEVYLVKDEGEFVAPVRRAYIHTKCGGLTTVSDELAKSFARDPKMYGFTYCCHCQMHLSVAEFKWDEDGIVLGMEETCPVSGNVGGSPMRKYRKKPVVVDAFCWTLLSIQDGVKEYESDNLGRECGHCYNILEKHGWIDTLEGGHIVCPGDWIITGVKGERYPCKPDIFDATYEPVD